MIQLSNYIGVFVVSSMALAAYRWLAPHFNLLDIPNSRSMHQHPTVRGAGLVFISVWLIYCYWFASPQTYSLLAAASLLMLLSFVDDRINLSAKIRFTSQSIIVAAFCCHYLAHTSWIIIAGLSVVGVWAINLFNFMDGVDGYATAQASIFSILYTCLFAHYGVSVTLPLTLLVSLLSFMIWNFPAARMFMGDAGSVPLGFVSFAFSILLLPHNSQALFYWLIGNSVFIFDATITLLRRMLAGEKWYSAHKRHAYQRIAQAGLSPRMLLGTQSLLNGASLASVYFMQAYANGLYLILPVQCLLLSSVYMVVEKYKPMFTPVEEANYES